MEKNMEATRVKVGVRAYDVLEGQFGQKENALYVADSRDSLQRFLVEEGKPLENYRFDPVRFRDIFMEIEGFREYCLEPKAMEMFEKLARAFDFNYTAKRHPGESEGRPEFFKIRMGDLVPKEECSETDERDDRKAASERFSDFEQPLEKLREAHKGLKKKRKKNVSDLLKKIENLDGEDLRMAIALAVQMKDEITPYLIDVLKKIAANPSEYINRENDRTRFFALMLLGSFRETRAHRFIVDIVRLPDRTPQDLFHDVITEDLPVILLRTCGGSMDSIKWLIENKNVEAAVRGAAAEALVFSVVEGYAEREEVLSYLGEILAGEKAGAGSGFGGLLAWIVFLLCPVELNEIIQKAYEDGVIAPGFISYGEFEETFREGKEKSMKALADDLRKRSLDDPYDRMSSYPYFKKVEPIRQTSPEQVAAPKKKPADPLKSKPKKTLNKKKASNKKKRKMKKASKRKNRRR